MTATDRYLKFNEIRGAGHGFDDALQVVQQMRMAEEVGISSPLSPPRPYPVLVACFCELEGVAMVRSEATDRPGDTPEIRFADGCNECFVCPKCDNRELFPPLSMFTAEAQRFYPGWGERRFAGHGDAA